MKKGNYTNSEGKKENYTYVTSLTLSQKANYVMEVADMLVSSSIGYAYILKDAIFNYCLIKYFTDIELFKSPDEFNLDMIDSFCNTNKECVIEVVKKDAESGLIDELVKACDEAIEFRKLHFSDYREEVSDLLAVVREYVVKPDYMNELLVAFTNYLNKASEREIDVDIVNKLSSIMPMINNMDNVDVAKTIIDMKEKTVKNTKGNSKKTSSNNLEVVK